MVEAMPWLGGRVAQLGYMFSTHDCLLCRGTSDHGYGCTRPAISPAFLDHNLHPNIEILTNTDVIQLEGQPGDFTVRLRHRPTYVDPRLCTNCGLCEGVCPVSVPSSFQMELSERKAIHKMAPRSIPNAYIVDRVPRCDTCGLCQEICPTGAVNLAEPPSERDVHVGAIILATGFDEFDAGRVGFDLMCFDGCRDDLVDGDGLSDAGRRRHLEASGRPRRGRHLYGRLRTRHRLPRRTRRERPGDRGSKPHTSRPGGHSPAIA